VVTVFRHDSATTFPAALPGRPWDWNWHGRDSWRFDVVGPTTPVRLFDPSVDAARMAFSRIGDAGRRGLFSVDLSRLTGQPVFRLEMPGTASGPDQDDYTASLVVRDRIAARQETVAAAEAIRLRLRGLGPRQVMHVTLMEEDGTSWTSSVEVDSSWVERAVPLTTFTAGRGVLLPQGFPGQWNYWVGPAAGRGGPADHLRLDRVERLQFSLRRESGAALPDDRSGVEVEWVTLVFGPAAPGR
jgi:hypothetical protein